MRTKIQLGTSGSIDLSDEVAYSLNYAIADIREPDKRNANFSKTITIPGSKTNNKLFQHIFEINADSGYDPNKKISAAILVDEIQIMKGYLRLLKINRLDNQRISYEISIIGNVGNIFIDMGDNMLSSLDFSEFNHTYNKVNQKASWTAAIGSGYVYPFIDYGYTNGNTMDVKNFFPAIYAKQYIDKICSTYGYSYTSNFLDSTIFKSLIIPYNGKALTLTESQITPRLFNSYVGSSGTITIPQTANTYSSPFLTSPNQQIVPFNYETTDPSNQYNTSNYHFTCANEGNYRFDVSINYQLNSVGNVGGWFMVIKYSSGVETVLGSFYMSATNVLGNTTFSQDTYLLKNDQVYIGAMIANGSANSPKLNIATGGYFKNAFINTGVIDGDTVVMSNAVPEKIKQKDFFMSIVKMFNLYIETDKNYTNKLYIEPRDSFYSLGVNRDWTTKLDVSRDLEITPMGQLDVRQFIYTYTEDKDYYNDLYKKSYNEPYGTRTINIDNDFLTGKKETKVIFSPTPLVGDSSTDRVISKIFSTDNAGNIAPKESNIRILYYGGVKTTAQSWNYTSSVTGTSTETTYPYAGHLDNPSNPYFDLNFAVPSEVYYSTLIYTNGNLYNKYHKKFLEEIIDKDSKIIAGYFYLTPLDIYLLNFRDTFYVRGIPLRLNKIYDYDAVNQGLTKCEFIKIKYTNAFDVRQSSSQGGNDTQFIGGNG